MQEIRQKRLTGERALFHARDLKILDCVFDDGESPLKESRNIELDCCLFRWKYPLWYSENITLRDCSLFDMARAGIWYTRNIRLINTVVEAPKNLRQSREITLRDVNFPNASETLWSCDGVTMERVTAMGDYFAMNSKNMVIDGLTLVGNYSFDGVENVEIRNSRLLSKDAFWNSNNVTVQNCFISGEYLGWNAKNLTLIDCTVESLQGLCYIDHLVMRNCKLINTTLAFEYSTVDAEIDSRIDSVLNPTAGRITADAIDELILEPHRIDPSKTVIVCKGN